MSTAGLGSRLLHMARIISDPENFVEEAARLVSDMVLSEYGLTELLAECGKLMLRISTDLGVASGVFSGQPWADGQICRPGLYTAIREAAQLQIQQARAAAARQPR